MLDAPIPASLIADEPFTLDDLAEAITFLARHGDDPVAELIALTPEDLNAVVHPTDPTDDHAAALDAVDRVARFRIPDPIGDDVARADELAEWCGRHLAAATAERDRIAAQAKDWRARIDEWEAAEVRRLDRRLGFFHGHLANYLARWRALDPKRNKTKNLPSVSLRSSAKNVGGAVKIADEDQVLAWAGSSLPTDEYAQAVKTTESVLVSKLRPLLTIRNTDDGQVAEYGGEVVPGVVVEPEGVNLTVKVL